MNATDNDSASGTEADSHAYFRAVEEAFIRLRGAPFLLSPEDWRIASGWWEAGVPLELVERVLEKILRRREEAEAGKAKRVRSLRYFDSAVVAAWKGVRSVAGSEDARQAPALDIRSSLAALAAALPKSAAGREELARRILALDGDTEAIEKQLAELDREMMRTALAGLDPEERQLVSHRVDAGLERVGGRLSADEVESARRRLEGQVVRRRLDLPLLSLFSPHARGPHSS